MIPLEYIAGAAAVIVVTAYIFFGSDISSSEKSLSAYSGQKCTKPAVCIFAAFLLKLFCENLAAPIAWQ